MTTAYDQARRLRELVRETRCQKAANSRSPAIVAVIDGSSSSAPSITQQLAEELLRQSVSVTFGKAATFSQTMPVNDDIVLIDAGIGFDPISAPVWRQADLVLLVVASSRESLLEAYAAIKGATTERPDLPVHLLPYRCADEQQARNVHQRMSESCERFLGFAVPAAPWLPYPGAAINRQAIHRLAEHVRRHVLAVAGRGQGSEVRGNATSASPPVLPLTPES